MNSQSDKIPDSENSVRRIAIRCGECGKLIWFQEAKGSGTISTVCPRCHTRKTIELHYRLNRQRIMRPC